MSYEKLLIGIVVGYIGASFLFPRLGWASKNIPPPCPHGVDCHTGITGDNIASYPNESMSHWIEGFPIPAPGVGWP